MNKLRIALLCAIAGSGLFPTPAAAADCITFQDVTYFYIVWINGFPVPQWVTITIQTVTPCTILEIS